MRIDWEFRPEGGEFSPIEVPGPWQRRYPDLHGRGEYRARLVRPDADPLRLRFEAVATEAVVRVDGVEVGRHLGAWTPFVVDLTPRLGPPGTAHTLTVDVDESPRHATAGFLPVIGGAFGGLWGPVTRTGATAVERRAAADPGVEVVGDRIRHRGRPLVVRGLLHWGAYPELGAPRPDRAAIAREVDWMLALGFNLVKFCLFVPPEEYLQVCDDAGLLVWQEYPVWDRPLRGDALVAEFDEMISRDAPYACVIARTLTCENRDVDPDTARALVALARARAPGGLLLDNSSFLFDEGRGFDGSGGDFHDEHAYLHTAAWRRYPRRTRAALAGRPPKPLLLGETLCVDGWRDVPPRPGDEEVAARANRIALQVRKDQVEILRRELPSAGYVMNTIRDIEAAPLGLQDTRGRARWTAADFTWHRDTMVLAELDAWGVAAGGAVEVPLTVSHQGAERLDATLAVDVAGGSHAMPLALAPGDVRSVGAVPIVAAAVREPAPIEVRARIDGVVETSWTLWSIPSAGRAIGGVTGDAIEGASRVRVAAPRPGSLRCPAHPFLSPIPRFAPELRECEAWVSDLFARDLLSGRVLRRVEGMVPLVEVLDLHDKGAHGVPHPVVAALRVDGELEVWSALRHDLPAGRHLLRVLENVAAGLDPARCGDVERRGAALVIEDWTMTRGDTPAAVVRAGTGVDLEGRATFRARFELPGRFAQAALTLVVEAAGDGFLAWLDGEPIGGGGNMEHAWDGCRFQPRLLPIRPGAGPHELRLDVRDWCAYGAMVGPVWITDDVDVPFL